MSQMETLTGISAHKLRIWERRYSFLNPMRTETNIRYYNASQLKKLLNIGILSRNGFRISKIDKMTDEEIFENVTNILSNVSFEHQDEINALILHMMNYDELEIQAIFQRSTIRLGFLSTITDLIYPFLNQLGILWGTNKIIPSQEHFISNLVRQKIISAIDSLPIPGENSPSIAAFLLDNEDHEIGLLLSSFIAKSLGWKVYYFGQRVPNRDIKLMIEQIKPTLALTMFTTPKGENEIKQIKETFESINDVPLLISENIGFESINNACSHYEFIKNPNELIEFLKSYKVSV